MKLNSKQTLIPSIAGGLVLSAATLCQAGPASGQGIVGKSPVTIVPKHCETESGCARADAHAPIGVMADHMHRAGEFMTSYRYMYMHMDGHRAGTDSLSSQEVLNRGFERAATEMDMEMHMLGLMYAPTDNITLMAMGSYLENDMSLVSASGSHGGGHGHQAGASSHGGHGHGGHSGTNHGHSSSGWGDTTVGALFRIFDGGNRGIHAGLGVSIPTGEELERDSNTGHVLPYGMQLGSGTWDLKPSITYTAFPTDRMSYGLQVGGTIRLEDENDAGYALGDVFNATTWVAANLDHWISASVRLNYQRSGDIDGHYNVPHPHAAPPHFTENYGGDLLEAGVGINVALPKSAGILAGHRIAVEAMTPVYQDLNGVGMEREWTFTVGWQKAF